MNKSEERGSRDLNRIHTATLDIAYGRAAPRRHTRAAVPQEASDAVVDAVLELLGCS
jgi:hypothetical protein